MRMAKASALSHRRFGEAAGVEANDAEQASLVQAQSLLKQAFEACEGVSEKDKPKMVYECLITSILVCLQAEDAAGARTSLDEVAKLKRPYQKDEADELKSFEALLNRLETAIELKKGANAIEDTQKELQAAVADKDKPKVIECLEVLYDMFKESKVTWDKVRTCKVGKDVGLAMKMGDPDISAQGTKCVQEIQA